MSRNLPWEEPFSNLLGQAVSNWGGKRSDGNKDGSGSTPSATALMVYPVYSGELRGFPFTIQVSGFPIFRPERFELPGTADYLRVHISRSLACNLEIHNKNILSRRMLAGRTDDLFKTDSDQSDDEYYIEVRFRDDRKILDNPKCRLAISHLEPFVVLALTPTGLYWAQELAHPDQFNYESISQYVNHLIDLLELVVS